MSLWWDVGTSHRHPMQVIPGRGLPDRGILLGQTVLGTALPIHWTWSRLCLDLICFATPIEPRSRGLEYWEDIGFIAWISYCDWFVPVPVLGAHRGFSMLHPLRILCDPRDQVLLPFRFLISLELELRSPCTYDVTRRASGSLLLSPVAPLSGPPMQKCMLLIWNWY